MNFDGMNYMNNNDYSFMPYQQIDYPSLRKEDNRNMNNNMNMNYNLNDPMQMIDMMNQNQNQNQLDLARPNEAFIQGNLFNNLYEGYKNYRPMRLVPNNKQAELLLNLDIFKFAAHELRLYLDIYPNDKTMIDLFNQYNSRANELLNEYEQSYGPIAWSALSNPNEFNWTSTRWPWEMEVM